MNDTADGSFMAQTITRLIAALVMIGFAFERKCGSQLQIRYILNIGFQHIVEYLTIQMLQKHFKSEV